MSLAGKGWDRLEKIPAVFHLLHSWPASPSSFPRAKWRAFRKPSSFPARSSSHSTPEAYRFDDYHAITDVFILFSILLLLKLNDAKDDGSNLKFSVALGVLSGLAITTRFTDGMALCLTTALAITYLAKTRKTTSLAAFSCMTSLVILAIVLLTGDTLRDYAMSTIFHAAGPKGGLFSVLTRPVLLLWNSTAFLFAWKQLATLLYCAGAAASWIWLLASCSDLRKPGSLIKATCALGVLAAAAIMLWPTIPNGDVIVTLSAICVIAGYAFALFLLYRLVSAPFRGTSVADPKRVILFLPFSLLLTGSMSSAGYHFGLYEPIAFLILTVIVVFPALSERKWVRSSVLFLAALMAVSGAYYKTLNPASWHTYRSFPMFAHRVLVPHPTYGTMVIDDSLQNFVAGICGVVSSDGKSDLLSIPFPYANYYCNIPPWQGFVQTFFDLSGKEVIDDMMAKLQRSPPQWILYQRQLDNLAMHEKVFNNGKRLPHRDLDDYIVRNLVSGQWHLVMRGQDKAGSDWLLMRTK